MVTVGLFGVPRLRAGRSRCTFEVATVGAALAELALACPALAGTVISGPCLHPSYRLSLNGDRFVTDPETPLAPGDSLWLLAADVGG